MIYRKLTASLEERCQNGVLSRQTTVTAVQTFPPAFPCKRGDNGSHSPQKTLWSVYETSLAHPVCALVAGLWSGRSPIPCIGSRQQESGGGSRAVLLQPEDRGAGRISRHHQAKLVIGAQGPIEGGPCQRRGGGEAPKRPAFLHAAG